MLFCPGALDLSRSARTLVVDLIAALVPRRVAVAVMVMASGSVLTLPHLVRLPQSADLNQLSSLSTRWL
ncbi:hypothetical protein [Actinomadura madurae]|uniref:hypothetical protein n=1 Tax=Actinomadura madurae TaxID=1993 RepID=UPI002026FF0C|nr:hypothetical protein [Actinomadura madurae]MCP9955733.1 hypothetical protein [Actinomadura madurae]MCP9972464.1 hypothetical protein [Actinomadura madurae]MCP9984977.1 hypothetical protein [Actinomadura madurae]MCQ0003464.1 hypothetical protein [Actinomadura madurae]MCQ0021176.1 hypothetical protein [Actinomadura madurae]